VTELDRTERNHRLIQQAHPAFRLALARLLAGMQALGWRPRLQCVWRSQDDEAIAHATGHSEVLFSFHNVSDHGQPAALAADVLDDDAPLQIRRPYVLALAREARKQQLETGILWGLPANVRDALNATIATGGDWSGGVGWDPMHVQWSGITLEQARAGVRPSALEIGSLTAPSPQAIHGGDVNAKG